MRWATPESMTATPTPAPVDPECLPRGSGAGRRAGALHGAGDHAIHREPGHQRMAGERRQGRIGKFERDRVDDRQMPDGRGRRAMAWAGHRDNPSGFVTRSTTRDRPLRADLFLEQRIELRLPGAASTGVDGEGPSARTTITAAKTRRDLALGNCMGPFFPRPGRPPQRGTGATDVPVSGLLLSRPRSDRETATCRRTRTAAAEMKSRKSRCKSVSEIKNVARNCCWLSRLCGTRSCGRI